MHSSDHTPGDDAVKSMLRFGLSRAIQVHSETVRSRRPNLVIDLDLIDDEGLLPEVMLVALFRIYEEAMENILHHAEAGQVWVHYYPSSQAMTLEIRDDGRGFSIPDDWAEFSRGKTGVVGMKRRIETIGGSLQITSSHGEGTKIRATAPLDWK